MPTIPPAAPASVSARPSTTLATRRIDLGPDDNLVNALAAAAAGDVFTFRPGLVLPSLTLPTGIRPGWVSIIAAGVKTSALTAPAGAQGWRVVGLEVVRPTVPDQQTVYNLVDLSEGSRAVALDSCYIHGTPTGNTRRGIALNGADLSIIKSKITEIHETTAPGDNSPPDTQAINGIHGAGPFLIEDVAIDCGTEGILFGGGDPSTKDLIPSDITIRRVQSSMAPSMLSGPFARKNRLELKNAQRVLIEDSAFIDFPGGVAIVLTPRNQNGTAPWSTVRDVLIRNCRVANIGSVVSGQTTDNEKPSAVAARIAIRNLLALGVTETGWSWVSGGGVLDDFELDHVTILGALRQAFQLTGTNLFRRPKVTNNLLSFGAYTQQWIGELKGEGAEFSWNLLVNMGGGDGGGPSRNAGWPGFTALNPDHIGLDIATGRHTAAGIGYQDVPLTVSVRDPDPDPPGSLPDRVTALETDVAQLKAWRAWKETT